MAPSTVSYDPIVSVEGMFKGSLTRLGYFFKDPKLYGGATLAVLRETAKRYDDALDDCLIQILDAKWLLEHQLAQNQARRAQEAAGPEAESKKRKLEDVSGGESGQVDVHKAEESSAKRIKVQLSPDETLLSLEPVNEDHSKEAQRSEHAQNADNKASDATDPGLPITEEMAQKDNQPADKDSSEAVEHHDEKSNWNEQLPQIRSTAALAGGSKEQKDQAEREADGGAMNFESMFQDANAGNEQNNDLNFNLDLNPDNLGSSNPFDSATHDPNNLELLPGLESYANASGDDFTMLNLPPPGSRAQSGVGAVNDDFGLPEIQGDSNFNDLFADGDFDGNASLVDLDLEDGIFNTQ